MKKRTLFTLIGASGFFISVLFTACYPGEELSYSDLDLVATAYDQKADFTAFKTYYMPDSIVHLKDTLNLDNNVDISRAFDSYILDLVRTNMGNYGYTLEADPEDNPPDLFLTVSAMATENYSVYYYYPYYYYGWGWGWYYKNTENADYYGWGGYYPPYWGGAYVTSYTSGSLIMNMHDVHNATADTDSIPIVWIGGINGLIGSSTQTTANRLEYNINQAFTQSPYLKTN